MNAISSHDQHGSFPPIVTAIICIAALYFARAVLVPISLAILLSFLLAPAVRRLERWHLGRTGPVIVAVVGTILVLVALGWVVGKQAINLAGEIPHYSNSISKKIAAIRGVKNGGLGKAASTVNNLGAELSQTIQAPAADSGSASPTANRRSAVSSTPVTRHPVPVEVVASPESSVRSLRSLLGPVLGPIATIGIVIVFATFMLLRHEDLRDRLFTLAGLNRIHVTGRRLAKPRI